MHLRSLTSFIFKSNYLQIFVFLSLNSLKYHFCTIGVWHNALMENTKEKQTENVLLVIRD